jgi:RNase H-like domain found in reverse transcriptase
MNWLLLRSDVFSTLTDHRNLIYLFNPHRSPSGTSAHSAAKLIRWALKLSAYQYTIEYIPGHENVGLT